MSPVLPVDEAVAEAEVEVVEDELTGVEDEETGASATAALLELEEPVTEVSRTSPLMEL